MISFRHCFFSQCTSLSLSAAYCIEICNTFHFVGSLLPFDVWVEKGLNKMMNWLLDEGGGGWQRGRNGKKKVQQKRNDLMQILCAILFHRLWLLLLFSFLNRSLLCIVIFNHDHDHDRQPATVIVCQPKRWQHFNIFCNNGALSFHRIAYLFRTSVVVCVIEVLPCLHWKYFKIDFLLMVRFCKRIMFVFVTLNLLNT